MTDTPRTNHYKLTIDPTGNRIGGASRPTAGSMKVAGTSPMAPASAELADFRNSLGWIDARIVSRQARKEVQKAAAHAYLQLIEAQKQLLLTKITLGLDEEQKRLVIDAFERGGAMDQEIQVLSAEFTTEMFRFIDSRGMEIGEGEVQRLAELDARYQAGRLTEARYQQLREMVGEGTDHTIEVMKDLACQLINGHVSKIQLSLQLFKERVLKRLG